MDDLKLVADDTGIKQNTRQYDALSDDVFFSQVLGKSYTVDPYPVLKKLQFSQPVYQSSMGPWVIFSYEEARALLKDPRLVGDPKGTRLYKNYVAMGQQEFSSHALTHMQFTDGAEHSRVRGNFATYISNSAFKEQLREWAQEIVDTLINEISQQKSEIELVSQFAGRLPARLFCRILDVPETDDLLLSSYANDLVAADDPDFLLTEQRYKITVAASQKLSRYLGEKLIRKKHQPSNDLLSYLLSSLDIQRFQNLQELIVNLIFFIVAGIKTTSDFISNTIMAFYQFPQQKTLFIENTDNMDNMLTECFRYDSPIQQTPRFTTEVVEVKGIEIPAGEHVMIMISSANRDPQIFDQAHELNLLRVNAKSHIGFGGGAHFCLGSMFARMEAEVALPAFLSCFPNYQISDESQRGVGFTLRGFERLIMQQG